MMSSKSDTHQNKENHHPMLSATDDAACMPQKDNETAATSTATLNNSEKNHNEVFSFWKMKNAELREECKKRGLPYSGNKGTMLEHLGVPIDEWDRLSKLKMADLKPILKSKGLKVTGNKQDLLVRLGLPLGYGETYFEQAARERREWRKQQNAKNKRAKKLDPAEDPTHELFNPPCCSNPSFANAQQQQPAGSIDFPDGSVMEVYKCGSCGRIPSFPNAPPLYEYSDHDAESDGDKVNFPHPETDYVIQ